MHSFIVIGGTKLSRERYMTGMLKKMSISPFDVVTVDNQSASIGIGDIRLLQQHLTLRPAYSRQTIGYIKEADLLTQEAQQALLKTLEEPPPHAELFLTTSFVNALLPTVISRCQIINIGHESGYSNEDIELGIKSIGDLQQGSIGKRLECIDSLVHDRDQAISCINLVIISLHKQMSSNQLSGYNATRLLRKSLLARQHLAINVNPKLVLDVLFM